MSMRRISSVWYGLPLLVSFLIIQLFVGLFHFDVYPSTSQHSREMLQQGYPQDMERLLTASNTQVEPETMPRLMAIYFPQYHPDPINDKNWGPNFTDWVSLNASASHNRLKFKIPRPTDELGYYNLNDFSPRQQQAKLAKQHGLDGFIYHHYWFYDPHTSATGPNLAQPLLNMLQDGEPNLPFFFNWCTVSWINVWMGKSVFQKGGTSRKNAIVLQQQYFNATRKDIQKHYDWLSPFFHHDNYIKIRNQPIFMTYTHFDGAPRILQLLREMAQADGFDGLHFMVGRSSMPDQIYKPQNIGDTLQRLLMRTTTTLEQVGMDAGNFSTAVYNQTATYPYPLAYVTKPFKVPHWCLAPQKDKSSPFPTAVHNKQVYPEATGVITTFDNSPRRPHHEANIYNQGEPAQVLERFEQNLFAAVYYQTCCVGPDRNSRDDSSERDNRFVMINAWNEWGEGMALEPSDVYGTGFLKVIQKVKQQVREANCLATAVPKKYRGHPDDGNLSNDDIRNQLKLEYHLQTVISNEVREYLEQHEQQESQRATTTTTAPTREQLRVQLLQDLIQRTTNNATDATVDEKRRYNVIYSWLTKSQQSLKETKTAHIS